MKIIYKSIPVEGSPKEIAELLTTIKPEVKAKRVYRKKKSHKFWTKEEDEIIRENKNLSASTIRNLMDKSHTTSAVSNRRYRLLNGYVE